MIARERSLMWLTALVFLASGVIGGGRTSPNLSMFVELIAAVLAAFGVAGLVDGAYPRPARPALFLLALICLVPLLQIIPLPPGLWRGLPGREVPDAISRLMSLGDLARPFSLAPEQTRIEALALIVPVAMFIATLQISPEGRDRFLMIVVGFAFVSAVLGVFQVAAGGGIGLGIYAQTHEGYPIGFFANRNHEGDLLLIALPACAHLIRSMPWRRRTRHWAMIGATVFLSLAVISTQSRTAFTLLPIALGGALMVWIGDIRDRRIWIGFATLLALSLISYAIVRVTPAGARLAHRFTTVGDDLRPQIWEGSWAAVKAFWPLGSGIGSFVPVYEMFEDLNSVTYAWVNHAHNDYLEILLEAGIVGAVLMVGYVVVAGIAVTREIPRALRSQRYAVIFMILILLAHSLTDYPLRTFTLLSIFAFANGALFPPREIQRYRRAGPHPVDPPPAFAMGNE